MVDVRKKHKETAINLRKRGLSYSEILAKIPVAKSTLSEWLHSVGLSKKQKQRLTEKKRLSALRGAAKKRAIRIEVTSRISAEAIKDIGQVSRRELFLIGVALYWAEGSKEKEERPGSGVQFTNSDGHMAKLFLRWLHEICSIGNQDIAFDLFIHENHRFRLNEIKRHWSSILQVPRDKFKYIYFKKHNPKTNRVNTQNTYFGVVKIRVKKSSVLNRRIAGWVKGIIQYV